jgi:hypothetical protein
MAVIPFAKFKPARRKQRNALLEKIEIGVHSLMPLRCSIFAKRLYLISMFSVLYHGATLQLDVSEYCIANTDFGHCNWRSEPKRGRSLKSLSGRGARDLERFETIGKPRHINSDVV